MDHKIVSRVFFIACPQAEQKSREYLKFKKIVRMSYPIGLLILLASIIFLSSFSPITQNEWLALGAITISFLVGVSLANNIKYSSAEETQIKGWQKLKKGYYSHPEFTRAYNSLLNGFIPSRDTIQTISNECTIWWARSNMIKERNNVREAIGLHKML
ncbi:MAG: hypothetical protein V4576_04425 [Patescibacteria group bacterium]